MTDLKPKFLVVLERSTDRFAAAVTPEKVYRIFSWDAKGRPSIDDDRGERATLVLSKWIGVQARCGICGEGDPYPWGPHCGIGPHHYVRTDLPPDEKSQREVKSPGIDFSAHPPDVAPEHREGHCLPGCSCGTNPSEPEYVFWGNAQATQQVRRLEGLLKVAISTGSGLQQPDHASSAEEAVAQEKDRRKASYELQQALRGIVVAFGYELADGAASSLIHDAP